MEGKWDKKHQLGLKIVRHATALPNNLQHQVTMTVTQIPIQIPIQYKILLNHALLLCVSIMGAVQAPIQYTSYV